MNPGAGPGLALASEPALIGRPRPVGRLAANGHILLSVERLHGNRSGRAGTRERLHSNRSNRIGGWRRYRHGVRVGGSHSCGPWRRAGRIGPLNVNAMIAKRLPAGEVGWVAHPTFRAVRACVVVAIEGTHAGRPAVGCPEPFRADNVRHRAALPLVANKPLAGSTLGSRWVIEESQVRPDCFTQTTESWIFRTRHQRGSQTTLM